MPTGPAAVAPCSIGVDHAPAASRTRSYPWALTSALQILLDCHRSQPPEGWLYQIWVHDSNARCGCQKPVSCLLDEPRMNCDVAFR